MKRTFIQPELSAFPSEFHPLLAAPVYDSSCSAQARVWFLEAEGGLFLKSAPKGELGREAELTACFHQLGLGAEVLAYRSREQDWLLTRAVPGEDCLDGAYLSQPERLCEKIAELAHLLHSCEPAFPLPDRTEEAIARAIGNFQTEQLQYDMFPGNWDYDTPEAAFQVLKAQGHTLAHDTLIHGDFCLPNILLKDWQLGGFIDLGAAGLGDKHMDLFWAAWSLDFNLKEKGWGQRFLDAYGKENYDLEALKTIAALEALM